MKDETAQLCQCCGAKMVKYTHNLSRGLVTALFKLVMAGKEQNLQDIGLTVNEYNNFQKLRYWGLAEQGTVSGSWLVTERGKRFVANKEGVSSKIVTYRGEAVESCGGLVFVNDRLPIEYQKKDDYVSWRKNYEQPAQQEFFKN